MLQWEHSQEEVPLALTVYGQCYVMRRDGDQEHTEVPDVRQGLGFSLCAVPLDAYCPQISDVGLEVWTRSSGDNQC